MFSTIAYDFIPVRHAAPWSSVTLFSEFLLQVFFPTIHMLPENVRLNWHRMRLVVMPNQQPSECNKWMHSQFRSIAFLFRFLELEFCFTASYMSFSVQKQNRAANKRETKPACLLLTGIMNMWIAMSKSIRSSKSESFFGIQKKRKTASPPVACHHHLSVRFVLSWTCACMAWRDPLDLLASRRGGLQCTP